MKVLFSRSKRTDDTLAEAFLPFVDSESQPYIRVFPFNLMKETLHDVRQMEDIICGVDVHELSHIFGHTNEREAKRIAELMQAALEKSRNMTLTEFLVS